MARTGPKTANCKIVSQSAPVYQGSGREMYTDRAGDEDNKQGPDTKRDVVIAGDNIAFRRLRVVALSLGARGTSCTMSKTTVSRVVD